MPLQRLGRGQNFLTIALLASAMGVEAKKLKEPPMRRHPKFDSGR